MRVLVAGLGLTGRSLAGAALTAGWEVRAADSRADLAVPPEFAERLRAVHLGPLTAQLLADADVVLTSPGLDPRTPVLAAAAERGVPVWSEPETAWRLNGGRSRLVGVTGTNGKTTTTQMIAEALQVPAAGNIGTPLIDVLTDADPPPLVVAELSSFQLHFCDALRPDAAGLLNIADDHLDWHGGRAAYTAAKARLWRRQRWQDTTVVVAGDPGAAAAVAAHPPPGHLIRATIEDAILQQVPLRAQGPHNAANAVVAAHCAVAVGADPEQVRVRLAAFEPGGHRMETVADVGGVRWVNDSKATNPHAAVAAIRSFERVVLIAGGLNKGLTFESLVPALRAHGVAVLTIGSCGDEIAAAVEPAGLPVTRAGTLEAAVTAAAARARPGDTVLLAPAAASFDQFDSYAQRGEAFRALVRTLPRPTPGQPPEEPGR